MTPRAYIASPLGFTEAGLHYYREVYLPALSLVVEPIDPWSFTSALEVTAAQARGQLRELWLAIGQRNSAAIRSADLLVALLDGQEVDSGTAAEVGYGAGLAKPCFGLRTDLRENGEAGVEVNLQVVSFILDSGGQIAGSLAELVTLLADWEA
jgi:nucleoside 2-deoxyribosyltransferase